MKTVVSFYGNPRMHWLAQTATGLARAGHLSRFYGSLTPPRSMGIDRRLVRSNPFPAALAKILPRLPVVRSRVDTREFVEEMFDSWVARKLERCDMLVACAAFATKSLERARALGALCVLDTASAHAEFGQAIVKEEHERWGVEGTHWPDWFVERMVGEYARADHILIPSGFVEKSFIDKGFDERRLIRVPFGVDTELFRSRELPREKPFRALAAGGGDVRKGIPYLMEAVKGLEYPDLQLQIIGGIMPELRPLLGQLRSCSTVSGVRHRKMPAVYAASHVVVLPSVEDGFGRVVLEAMACGRPVIVSENAGAAEVVRDGVDGFVVPIRDPEAIAEKLEILYRSPELRREMGVAARKRAEEFTWRRYGDHVAQELHRVWREHSERAANPSPEAGA